MSHPSDVALKQTTSGSNTFTSYKEGEVQAEFVIACPSTIKYGSLSLVPSKLTNVSYAISIVECTPNSEKTSWNISKNGLGFTSYLSPTIT